MVYTTSFLVTDPTSQSVRIDLDCMNSLPSTRLGDMNTLRAIGITLLQVEMVHRIRNKPNHFNMNHQTIVLSDGDTAGDE